MASAGIDRGCTASPDRQELSDIAEPTLTTLGLPPIEGRLLIELAWPVDKSANTAYERHS